MAEPMGWTRVLGRTGLQVSAITAGTSGLGSSTPMSLASQVIEQVLRSPIRSIDTANEYSGGRSERVIGEVLTRQPVTSPETLVLTKVDRQPGTDGFSSARVRQSLDESLERLHLTRLPLLFLHDPQKMAVSPGQSVFDAVTDDDGPLEGLLALKREGMVDQIGVAAGLTSLVEPLLGLGVFDAVLTHNRFTLVDRSAAGILDLATAKGIGVLNAAVFGGRILAQGPAVTTTYAYQPAAPPVLKAIVSMEQACARHGVPLAAAALQFSLRDPRVHSTVVGMSTPQRVDEAVDLSQVIVPPQLWDELESLTPDPRHWLDNA